MLSWVHCRGLVNLQGSRGEKDPEAEGGNPLVCKPPGVPLAFKKSHGGQDDHRLFALGTLKLRPVVPAGVPGQNTSNAKHPDQEHDESGIWSIWEGMKNAW